MIPTATYRLQFRNGMTFDRAAALVPYLKNLGISHLYASPIFTATKASTHGYDVTDANEIEPSIGGREGFERLVAELKAQGLGLIIDIVPNHMASSLENAWWRDVLEYGKESRYARHFDIDWSRRLTLPFLGDTFDAVLENGEIAIKPDPATGKPAFAYYDNYYPLAPATWQGREAEILALTDKAAIADLHERQPWKLMSWRDAARSLSYRRFFEVTGLVGMRVEDKTVFDDTHRLILELVRTGAVDGLRIDHIDGLADPKAYLARLRQEVGPACYITVEKILAKGEQLPDDWPVSGTTGYEFIASLAEVLVDDEQIDNLRQAYETVKGAPVDMRAELRAAKLLMVDRNFEGEFTRLLALALSIASELQIAQEESVVRQALRELLIAFPVYRTYGTAEGNELGPTLSFKGIDNFSYYRTMPDQHRYYINDTGTGNTVNTSHPRVLQMVMDSLRYWAESMHVDGFRFDLGTILGREPEGFDQRGGFFDAVTQDPVLAKLKLIGEPWDIGPGGYQVGGFPPGWGEWNDKYRDTVREYWKGDNVTNDFAARLLGSGDLYDLRGRRPWSSVNFITAHDGFTLNDLVSYNDKHNEANGEDNNDGHNDNRSCNYGAEGPTDDEGINAIRERQKRNFLTTLLFSHGTPMLLAGDEFGRSQMGNNNGYCQDSEISWVHWDNLPETANALREFTRHLIQLRATQPLLRRESWRDGLEIRWFNAGGGAQQSEQWDEGSTIGVCISRPDLQPEAGIWHDALLLFNPFEGSVPFRIPMWGEGGWVLELTTADNAQQGMRITEEMDFDLAGRSIVLFRRP